MTIEDDVAVALRAHADDEVDTEALLTRATHRGRARQRMRRAAAAGGAAVAVAALLTAAVAVPGVWSERSGTATPPHRNANQPPAAPGEPTALERPDVVGSNPFLMHLRLEPIPETAGAEMIWATNRAERDGSERIILSAGDGSPIGAVGLGPAPNMAAPGDDRTWTVAWEPAPGVLAYAISFQGLDHANRLAGALRLDRVFRCAVPLRLTRVPRGVEVNGCQMTFNQQGYRDGGLSFGTRDGGAVVTWMPRAGGPQVKRDHNTPSPDASTVDPSRANLTIRGRPAHWTGWGPEDGPGDKGGQLVFFASDDVTIEFKVFGRWAKAEAVMLAEGYLAAGGDPSTWPANPLT